MNAEEELDGVLRQRNFRKAYPRLYLETAFPEFSRSRTPGMRQQGSFVGLEEQLQR